MKPTRAGFRWFWSLVTTGRPAADYRYLDRGGRRATHAAKRAVGLVAYGYERSDCYRAAGYGHGDTNGNPCVRVAPSELAAASRR